MVFVLVVAAFVVAFAFWIAFPTERRIRTKGEEFARHNLAFVDSEFVAAFNAAMVRVDRYWAGTLVVGFAVTVAVFNFGLNSLARLSLVPVLCVAFVGWALLRLMMAGKEFPAPVGRRVTARVRRVSVLDYVSPWAWAAVTVSLVLEALLAGVVVYENHMGRAGGGLAGLAVGTTVVTVALALVVVLVIRAICARRQSAVDACHLYVQDAWRSVMFAHALAAVCWATYETFFGVLVSQADFVFDGPFSPNLLWVFILPAMTVQVGRMRWFRRRLWPGLAPHQVLLPGQALPPRREVLA